MEGKRGFTLIEALIVIMIISILASFTLPKISSSVKKAQVVKVINDMKTVEIAIQDYYLDNNAYPSDISVLHSEGYLNKIPNNISLKISDPYAYIYYSQPIANPNFVENNDSTFLWAQDTSSVESAQDTPTSNNKIPVLKVKAKLW